MFNLTRNNFSCDWCLIWKEVFCFLDNLTLTVKLLIFVRVTPIDSHRLNMFAKYMLPLLLVCSTICEKLSYEEILQAAKAGEIQDSGPTAPVKTKPEHVLDGRMAIYMSSSQRNVCPEFTLKQCPNRLYFWDYYMT